MVLEQEVNPVGPRVKQLTQARVSEIYQGQEAVDTKVDHGLNHYRGRNLHTQHTLSVEQRPESDDANLLTFKHCRYSHVGTYALTAGCCNWVHARVLSM